MKSIYYYVYIYILFLSRKTDFIIIIKVQSEVRVLYELILQLYFYYTELLAVMPFKNAPIQILKFNLGRYAFYFYHNNGFFILDYFDDAFYNLAMHLPTKDKNIHEKYPWVIIIKMSIRDFNSSL